MRISPFDLGPFRKVAFFLLWITASMQECRTSKSFALAGVLW
uniref:Uncharacterized protein n=1 Tax=Anguilla anguilla TaxID=7936 RepID=A0A0E9VSZ2_ANGAN